MPNAQKVTTAYKSAYLHSRLNPSTDHLLDKYDVGPEQKEEAESDTKNAKYFRTVLKEVSAKRRKI